MSTVNGVVNQAPGILDLTFADGDDFSFDVTFPFVITSHTVDAKIGGQTFTATKTTAYKIHLALSETQTTLANIPLNTTWYLKLTLAGYVRTYLVGKRKSY